MKTHLLSSSCNPPNAGGMLTPKEFAQTYKVSLSWLAKARQRGDGPLYARFGRSVRYFSLTKPDERSLTLGRKPSLTR
jgi:hypothetical protein